MHECLRQKGPAQHSAGKPSQSGPRSLGKVDRRNGACDGRLAVASRHPPQPGHVEDKVMNRECAGKVTGLGQIADETTGTPTASSDTGVRVAVTTVSSSSSWAMAPLDTRVADTASRTARTRKFPTRFMKRALSMHSRMADA